MVGTAFLKTKDGKATDSVLPPFKGQVLLEDQLNIGGSPLLVANCKGLNRAGCTPFLGEHQHPSC